MPDPSSTPLAAQLIFLLVLIVINALFAATEMSIVSANKSKIKLMAQDGNKKAELLLDLLDEPNKFLSTIQVAITFAGFLASASASVSMSDSLGALISTLGIPYGKQIAVVIVTLILSYVTLVLGELYPKRIALHHSETIAVSAVRPLLFFSKILTPFVWILSKTVDLMLIITRQQIEPEEEEFSEDEIMSMLEAGQESGELKEEGLKMIDSIFEFDDKLAYEIMTPRTDVFAIDADDPAEEYMDDMMELTYSRIPIYQDDVDNIIGILHIKDYLIKAREVGFDNVRVRDIMRKPYFVPETKNIDALFFDLKKTKQHMAILIDEYGGFSGICTMEDIIEEVMGDIEDEFDEDEQDIVKVDDNTYLVKGFVSLDDLNDETNLEIESENIESVGGFVLELLGEIPEENSPVKQTVQYENLTFTIESFKDRRVELVRLHVEPEEDECEPQEEEKKKDRDKKKSRDKDTQPNQDVEISNAV